MKYLKLFESDEFSAEFCIDEYWDVDPLRLKDVINSEIDDFGIKTMSFVMERNDQRNSYLFEIDEFGNYHWTFGSNKRADLGKLPGIPQVQKSQFFSRLIPITTKTPNYIKVGDYDYREKPKLNNNGLIRRRGNEPEMYFGLIRNFEWELYFPEILISIPEESEFNLTIKEKFKFYNQILAKTQIPYFMTNSGWKERDNTWNYTLYHL